ncbi:MAG: dihydroorotase [Syntrophaceae bacterium]
MKLLLKGGRILDPSRGPHPYDEKADLLIEDGKIAAIGAKEGSKKGAEVVDVKDRLVVPGLIDIHTHLREPGHEYKESVQSGTEAAVAGGFTAVACMPNTKPVNDSRSVTEFILRQARLANLARVYPIAAITMGSEGKDLTEFADLRKAGAVGFSDDGRPVPNSLVMRIALEYAWSFGLPVISHCEVMELSKGGLMHEGPVSTELGLPGIPSISESIMIARDIALAEYTGTAVHIAHVSSAGSVDLIRKAKARGVKVTAETAPHYLFMTDESLRDFDTNKKVNPPIGSREDSAALREGLKDGTIDAIASDHAPQSSVEKDVEFEYAMNGIIGMETSLGLCLKLVEEGVLTLARLIQKMSCAPAAILKVPGGALAPGGIADVTVIDPERKWTVDASAFKSKSRNCPFNGWDLKGKAVLTIVGGEIKYNDI